MKKSDMCLVGVIVFSIMAFFRFYQKNVIGGWSDMIIGFNFLIGYWVLQKLEEGGST